LKDHFSEPADLFGSSRFPEVLGCASEPPVDDGESLVGCERREDWRDVAHLEDLALDGAAVAQGGDVHGEPESHEQLKRNAERLVPIILSRRVRGECRLVSDEAERSSHVLHSGVLMPELLVCHVVEHVAKPIATWLSLEDRLVEVSVHRTHLNEVVEGDGCAPVFVGRNERRAGDPAEAERLDDVRELDGWVLSELGAQQPRVERCRCNEEIRPAMSAHALAEGAIRHRSADTSTHVTPPRRSSGDDRHRAHPSRVTFDFGSHGRVRARTRRSTRRGLSAR
jgi:hypothetical protein